MSKVFVAHGRDHKARNEVVALLTNLGITPVIFSKKVDQGRTIIEKFETLASQCEFAIIVLTPDDELGANSPDRRRRRARQNVIFEMGWFFSKLGRQKTLLMRKGKIELPSDITGLLYKDFAVSALELADDVKEALLAGGVRLRPRRR